MARPRRKRFLEDFVVVGMEMGICFGSVLSPHPSCSRIPRVLFLMSVDFCGMAGCLVLVLLVRGILGLLLSASSIEGLWNGVLVLSYLADDFGFWTVSRRAISDARHESVAQHVRGQDEQSAH